MKLADSEVETVKTSSFTRLTRCKEIQLVKLLDLTVLTDYGEGIMKLSNYVSFYRIEPKFTEWILQKWHESIK